jgi:O-methyltransferase
MNEFSRRRSTMFGELKRILFYNFIRPKLKGPLTYYKRSDEDDKFQHLLEAVNYVKNTELPGVFFEFGCHSGRTFSSVILAAQFLDINLNPFAFDSFQGLPQTSSDTDGIFEQGSFHTSIDQFKDIIKKKTGVTLPNQNIIEGFYEKTLDDNLSKGLPQTVGMVHIDVDLYSSTVSVLEFIKSHLIDGTVILFDDWFCFPPGKNMGEKKALDEFCQKNPDFRFVEWKNYSTFGKSFFVEIQSNMSRKI